MFLVSQIVLRFASDGQIFSVILVEILFSNLKSCPTKNQIRLKLPITCKCSSGISLMKTSGVIFWIFLMSIELANHSYHTCIFLSGTNSVSSTPGISVY